MTQRDDTRTDAPAGKPSQAEGSLNEREEGTNENETSSPAGKPSQAEGSRETVEEDLNEK